MSNDDARQEGVQWPSSQQLAALADIEGDVQMKAAQLGLLSSEYRANIARVLHHYEPQAATFRTIIYASEQKRKAVERELVWTERIALLQEQRCGTTIVSTRDLMVLEREPLHPVECSLKECYQKLENVAYNELCVLRNYEYPPRQAVATMRMIMRVRGEEDLSWENVQVVLSENYFYTFFVSRMRTLLQKRLPDDVLEELEQYCLNPEHAPEALAVVSVPLGVIGSLLHTVRDYFQVMDLVKRPVEPMSVEERRKKASELRRALQTLKEDAATATEGMADLKARIASKFVTVRDEYDDTMCPLHDDLEKKTEDFLKVLSGDIPAEEGATGEGECPDAM
ncbi:hypothetical protein DPX39_100034500 [Trypanosoma brucei equiperdum]|uniref:Uncharacterized protein n=1 Tax=Trypanosoma brucei equiperdum TaxID=630700 RepID=A0A3L6L384_9TRYP|nr:hypothetical protein DPX39_100034500 [Trypanosoma brucei equiperdum]